MMLFSLLWFLSHSNVEYAIRIKGETESPTAAASSYSVANTDYFFSALQSTLSGEEDISSATESDEKRMMNAPVSRLDLQLTGAVQASDPRRSLAIVAQQGKQFTLQSGEKVPGTQASIVRIYQDRIIVRLNGRFESLTMK